MYKFIFILGSNFQLSLAELDKVLDSNRFKGKIIDYSANIAVVEFDELHERKYFINDLMELQYILGGCQKIAQVYDFIDIRTIKEAFPFEIGRFSSVQKARDKIVQILDNSLPIVFPKIPHQNLFYAVSIYPAFFDEEYYSQVLLRHFLPFLNKEIMALLKMKGAAKALYYKYPEEYIKEGTLNPIFPHVLIKYGLLSEDRAEIIFGFTEEGLYLGRTLTCDDPSFKQKVDEERPFKEYRSSVSPKLALIMLNFLNLFEERGKKKVLDPFVGNGTIPLFAIIEDFQIYGSDKEDLKVKSTLRNVIWLLEELEEKIPYPLQDRFVTLEITQLTTHFPQNFFDGIATEPELAPFFTNPPYYEEAQQLITRDIEPLYQAIFEQAHYLLKPHARLVLIAPIISTVDGGDVQINIEKVVKKNSFNLIPVLNVDRIVNKSNIRLQFDKNKVKALIDAKKDQIVKRKLYIFEKI
jgi:tRNA G10  N-methylase Trm11